METETNYKKLSEAEWKRRYAAELVRLGVIPSHAKACADQWYSRETWAEDDSPEDAAETDLDAARA